MTDFVRRHPLMSGAHRLRRCCSCCSARVAIVPETRQGIVVRFGKPVRIVNRYKPGEQFGATRRRARLRASRSPRDIVWIDKRVRDVDMERQQVLSTDQLPARGRRLRPLPHRRSAAHVHRRALRGPGRAGAAPDPRLAASQRAWQAPVRVAAVARARGRDGQYPRRPQPRRAPIWRRDHRRAHQEGRPARRHAAAVGL